MKSFDKWVDELRDQVNKKPELPEDVIEGNVDGEYLFRCRGCDNWKPIDWDLDEDNLDAHWCGGSPQCCPLVKGAPANPVPVAPSPGTPLGGKPIPPHPKLRPGMMYCPVCNTSGPINTATMHRPTGTLFCGTNSCRNYLDRYAPKAPPPAPPVVQCAGCSAPLNNSQIVYDKVTGAPTCGRHTCMAFVQKRSKLF